MITNKDLLSKKKFIKAAALKALPDIELTPEEADKFLDYVIDQSFWKDNARIVKMNKAEKNLRFLDFASGTRFLKPAATFSSSDYQKEFTSDKIELASKKVRGCVVIYDDDLEDGIEGAAFADHLMKLVAIKVANEIDEAVWVSASATGTPYASTDIRSLWGGWRYALLNNTVLDNGVNLLDASNTIAGHTTDFTDAGGIAVRNAISGVWEIKFAKMMGTLPSKYKASGLGSLRFFCNDIVENDYIEALSARSTVLGDNAIMGNVALKYGKVPIASVPQMPTTYAAVDGTNDGLEEYGSGAYTDCILTHKENFIIGMQRILRMESQRVAADEATYMFYGMRFDVTIQNPEAAVFLANLTHG